MNWIKSLLVKGISWSWAFYGKSLTKDGISFNAAAGNGAGKANKKDTGKT